MVTDIAYLEIRTRYFDECVDTYAKHLGLTEIQDNSSVLNEKGEWDSAESVENAQRQAVLQVGDSFLLITEDENAPTNMTADGQRNSSETQGSVGHWSFFVESNFHAYFHLKDFLHFNKFNRGTREGPSVQPMNHAYLQRSLLEFGDPNGYTIQLSEIVDPRFEKQDRRREKQKIANLATGTVIKGFDHFSMSCHDIDKAKEIYADKLGMQIIDHSENDTHEGYVFVAGLCDLEIGVVKDGSGLDRLGKGVVGSIGLWVDDIDATAKILGHSATPTQREIALGLPIRSFTIDIGDGLPVEIAQRVTTDA